MGDDEDEGVEASRDEVAEVAHSAALERAYELLARILGHDLRGPLAAMLTSTELAMRRTEDPRILQPLARASSSGHQLMRMIDQALDFSSHAFFGGISLRLAPADAGDIAAKVVAELGAPHPEGTLELRRSGPSAGTWDAERVGQLLSVLVGNALHHGTKGAPVRVDVDGSAETTVKLTVHNQGSVARELEGRLFDAFRGSDRKLPGASALGLGLYVARLIARAHGGDLEVSSSPERGTTFEVTLPRAPEPRAKRVSRDEFEELIAMERLANDSPPAGVTAQIYGAMALHQRAPAAFLRLQEHYGRLLTTSLERQVYKGERGDLSDELRAIADELGELRAGPREIAQLHARALRAKIPGMSGAKSQALVAEGRMMAFELMGHVLSFYRRRAG